tara:strand:+ start:305 stop:547 length:243 start_codon:yes stop_codon:yes gene_type:complete
MIKYICIKNAKVHTMTTHQFTIGDVIWVSPMEFIKNESMIYLDDGCDSNGNAEIPIWWRIKNDQLEAFEEYREHMINKII